MPCHLVELYLQSVGAVALCEVTSLFGWIREETGETVAVLVPRGGVLAGVTIKGEAGEAAAG